MYQLLCPANESLPPYCQFRAPTQCIGDNCTCIRWCTAPVIKQYGEAEPGHQLHRQPRCHEKPAHREQDNPDDGVLAAHGEPGSMKDPVQGAEPSPRRGTDKPAALRVDAAPYHPSSGPVAQVSHGEREAPLTAASLLRQLAGTILHTRPQGVVWAMPATGDVRQRLPLALGGSGLRLWPNTLSCWQHRAGAGSDSNLGSSPGGQHMAVDQARAWCAGQGTRPTGLAQAPHPSADLLGA